MLGVGPHEAGKLHPRPSVRRSQHHDLCAGIGERCDSVKELAFHECPALDFETEPDEKCPHVVEVPNGDTDVVKPNDSRPVHFPQMFVFGGSGPSLRLIPRVRKTPTPAGAGRGPRSKGRQSGSKAGNSMPAYSNAFQ